jgi:hypothetical protein
MPGRDSALRCPRPRGAGGTNRARICARLRSFRCLTLRSATGTAQRAIPTSFGVRVKLAAIPPKTAEKRACQRKWLRKWMLGRRRWSEGRRNRSEGRRNCPEGRRKWSERRRNCPEARRNRSERRRNHPEARRKWSERRRNPSNTRRNGPEGRRNRENRRRGRVGGDRVEFGVFGTRGTRPSDLYNFQRFAALCRDAATTDGRFCKGLNLCLNPCLSVVIRG